MGTVSCFCSTDYKNCSEAQCGCNSCRLHSHHPCKSTGHELQVLWVLWEVDYLVANGHQLLCGFMDDVAEQSMQNTLEAVL